MQKSKFKNQNIDNNIRRDEYYRYNFEFSQQTGFSLVEIIISIAVIGILAVLALGGFSSFKASSELFRAADTIIGIVNNARSQTLASRDNSQYGVFFNQSQNQVTFFTGGFYDASSMTNETTKLPTQIEISSLSLTNATASVAFSRLSGDPSATGTIILRIKGTANQTKTIQINDSGTVKIK